MLVLENISYKYEGAKKNALEHISTEFNTGKLYCIAGKSGSGKTTLLSLISGLDKVKFGKILYKGKSLSTIDLDKYRSKDIGVIFQGYNLLTNLTAVENIVLSMNISGVKIKNKEEEAFKVLEMVGIDREKAGRKILKLSGGEQQRIGIARALSHKPEILIADEPTGNLDRETEKEIMEIFVNLVKSENKAVIIVTHSEKVTTYADEVIKIKDGKLVG